MRMERESRVKMLKNESKNKRGWGIKEMNNVKQLGRLQHGKTVVYNTFKRSRQLALELIDDL